MAKKLLPDMDAADDIRLNGVRLGNSLGVVPWSKAFLRNYDVIFDHARPLVPDYRLED